MKKTILLFTIFSILMVNLSLGQAIHTIRNSGNTFNPATISAKVGDTINFVLASNHNAIEVGQATYNNDGNTPLSGGFAVNFGGGKVVVTQAKTYYYVCEPHASMGMKGTINVSAVTNSALATSLISSYNIFPNPANADANIRFNLNKASEVKISIYNLLGEKMKVDQAELNSRYSAGESTVTVDTNVLSSGIYLVELIANNTRMVKRLSVVK